eukprot:GHVN01036577.1.p1 GENE.GHVN01036577.1~~GHVN01036577.1.p1  ORF type:complete len:384 (+),score=56.50 GHVN01036577.1:14-1165(+)
MGVTHIWDLMLGPTKGGWHRNVYLLLWYRLAHSIAHAARSAGVLDSYLHDTFGDNKAVGLVSSVSGVAVVFVAPIAGLLADWCRRRRAKVLRGVSLMGFFSTGCHILAVQLGSMRLLLLSTFVHRLWNEVISIFVDALISDSIPKGRRSEVFFTSRIVSNLSHLLTPIISFFTFWYVSLTASHHTSALTDTDIHGGRELDQENMQVDFWDPYVVKASLQCLTLFWLPQIFTLLAWSEVPLHSHARTPPASPQLDPKGSLTSLSIGASAVPANQRLSTLKENGTNQTSEGSEQKGQTFMCLTEAAIPWIVYLSSFAMMAGAGMTVRFLPLFMKTEFSLSPTSLSMLSTCVTITSTICVIGERMRCAIAVSVAGESSICLPHSSH